MVAERWMVKPGSKADLSKIDPADTGDFADRTQANPAIDADLGRLHDLQEKLYVDDRFAVLLVLQGMDTSGKDGTIEHISKGVDLLGAEVTSFKQPSSTELQHGFLWRIHQRVPERGRIGIFNRSHYEDVVVVRVHELVPKDVWSTRYGQINAFEQILAGTNTVVLKCFLHISKKEQKERLQARLDEPGKHWKFNPADLKDRARWPDYMAAYEDALSKCSTEYAPWYVIPADKKWFRNYAVTRLLVETLERLDLRLPRVSFDPKKIMIE
jgi:PPK2 family polyphosphate:nucleotide phosphotransferase